MEHNYIFGDSLLSPPHLTALINATPAITNVKYTQLKANSRKKPTSLHHTVYLFSIHPLCDGMGM